MILNKKVMALFILKKLGEILMMIAGIVSEAAI
jgi:hypothetical protein